jgi:uncharacterized protein YecE (DUF72 family)
MSIRLHSGQQSIGYSDQELHIWATHIRGFLDRGTDVYAYFNNDPEGHALRDADHLRRLLVKEHGT